MRAKGTIERLIPFQRRHSHACVQRSASLYTCHRGSSACMKGVTQIPRTPVFVLCHQIEAIIAYTWRSTAIRNFLEYEGFFL